MGLASTSNNPQKIQKTLGIYINRKHCYCLNVHAVLFFINQLNNQHLKSNEICLH